MRRQVPWRRAAGIAALVLVVGLAATMAVPDARTAVLRFLGIKGATVIRVDELPPAATAPTEFGESVGLQEAERVVGFRPLLVDGSSPDDVRIDRFSPYFIILLYGEPELRLRLTQMVGGTIEKYVRMSSAWSAWRWTTSRGSGWKAGTSFPACSGSPGWRETSSSGSRKV